MITIQLKIVTIVSPEIFSAPSASFRSGTPTTDWKFFGLDPKIRSTTFCRK
jgi:hypothetical protein